MTDGELLHLLIGMERSESEAFDDRIYKALQSIKSASAKSLTAMFVAIALAILSQFGVLQRVGSNGLEIAPVVYTHIALVALSLTSAMFCMSYCKQTLLQSWFQWKFKRGSASERAECLLQYPDAYLYFTFLPGNIGYPAGVFAKRADWMQIVYLLLVLIALVISGAGFIFLWGHVAVQVWRSMAVDHVVSVLTVVACSAALLVGWLAPFYYDIPRTYMHYGLTNLMSRLDGEKLERAQKRVLMASLRMGLVGPSVGNGGLGQPGGSDAHT